MIGVGLEPPAPGFIGMSRKPDLAGREEWITLSLMNGLFTLQLMMSNEHLCWKAKFCQSGAAGFLHRLQVQFGASNSKQRFH